MIPHDHHHHHGHDHDHSHHHHDHDHDHHHHESPLDQVVVEQGTEFLLESEIDAPITKVWEVLTTNDFVQQWFPALSFESLESAGSLHFEVNGSSQSLMLYDVEAPNYLSFEWGEGNVVTFELEAREDGSTDIRFSEWIHHLNLEADANDLTHWLIRLMHIGAVAVASEAPDTNALYEENYPEIYALVEQEVAKKE